MSSVNFEHLKNWEGIYNSCCLTEKNIISDNKDEIIMGMVSLGKAFEAMVQELVDHVGITTEQIKAVMEQEGKDSNGKKVFLFGKILALQKFGVLTGETQENYHKLRKYRNCVSHAEEEERFRKLPLEKVMKDAEEMYSTFYKESHWFTQYYMTKDFGVNSGKKNAALKSVSSVQTESLSANQGGFGKGLLVAVIIGAIILIVGMYCSTLNEMMDTSKKWNAEYEQKAEEYRSEFEQEAARQRAEFEQTAKENREWFEQQVEEGNERYQQQVQQNNEWFEQQRQQNNEWFQQQVQQNQQWYEQQVQQMNQY